MRGHRIVWTAIIALSIGALTFVYRFNTLGGPLAGFDNDHFFQIVRAEAMLDGELPLRDYSDAELRSLWPQMTYAASAVAMRTMGPTLRSEALLDAGMLALGAAATMWAAATLSQAILPAVLATLLTVGLSPTLYNYPKIVIYAFAALAFLAYARRPRTLGLITLAVIEVLGTLYRHDHGVYLGISIGALLLLVHRRAAVRPLIRFALFVAIGLAPGLLYVQLHGGLIKYVSECLSTSSREMGRTASRGLGFSIDSSRKLLERAPLPSAPLPRIAVRWAGLTAADRSPAEQQLGLSDPEPRGNDQNWSYAIDAATPSHLEAIVHDPRIADTDGIDRQTFVLTSMPPPPVRGGVFGWQIAPGVLRAANAGPWLRLVAWGVIAASLLTLLALWRDRDDHTDAAFAAVAALTVLGGLLCYVFLRNAADYRLPDPAVPIAILGSWLAVTIPRLAGRYSPGLRIVTVSVLAVVTVLTVLAVGVIGTVPEQVAGTGVDQGPRGVSQRSRELWRTLGGLPGSLDGIDEHLASAAGYIRRCTQPSDRLLVADELPEMYYFARRRMAAGQIVFFGGFYTSDAAQQEEIGRWRQQDVPIALIQSGDRFRNDFQKNYPLLARYLQSRYRRAGRLDVERGTMLDVWIDPRVSWSRDAETQLPCRAPST